RLLFDAFQSLDEATTYKNSTIPRINTMNWGVAARQINRPLVIAPQRLSENEESYFLPFVFNVSKEEARMDYTDIQGSHNSTPQGVVQNYVNRIIGVCRMLEGVDASAPKKEF